MTNGDLKNGFIRYWQLAVVIVGMAAGYGALKADVNNLHNVVTQQQIDSKDEQAKSHETDKTIVRIDTTQKQLVKDVDEIKEEQKDQSKKLDKILEKLSDK